MMRVTGLFIFKCTHTRTHTHARTHAHTYLYGYTIPAFFAATLQHFIFCCKASFCCNAGIWHKQQQDVWYTMKLKEPVNQEIDCAPIKYGTFQDLGVCPVHTRNIGPIGPISSTIPSPWIQPLPEGMSDMPWMIQRATVPGKWLRPNHVRYMPTPTGSVLSAQEILDPPVQYPVLYHHLECSPYPKEGLICQGWLIPYPSGRVAAHHNRAGIGPMRVASDRRRPGTGPPRQVHRIRALVCVNYTTIPIYKYKIMKMISKWRWGSDSPSGTTACNKSARPHSRVPEECLPRRIESATKPLPRAIVQSGQPWWQPQATQTALCRSPRPHPLLHWTFEIYNSSFRCAGLLKWVWRRLRLYYCDGNFRFT